MLFSNHVVRLLTSHFTMLVSHRTLYIVTYCQWRNLWNTRNTQFKWTSSSEITCRYVITLQLDISTNPTHKSAVPFYSSYWDVNKQFSFIVLFTLITDIKPLSIISYPSKRTIFNKGTMMLHYAGFLSGLDYSKHRRKASAMSV